jgi:hypothetical protein
VSIPAIFVSDDGDVDPLGVGRWATTWVPVVGAAYAGSRDPRNGFGRRAEVFITACRDRAFAVGAGLYLDPSDIPRAWILRRSDCSVGFQ